MSIVMRKMNLSVEIYKTRKAMGEAAGKKAEELIVHWLKQKKEVRLIAGSAPSQNEIIAYLAKSRNIDWSRITAFHMDEFIGIGEDSPQSFGKWMRDRLFSKVPMKKANYIWPGADPKKECERYAALLSKAPIDVVLAGIGENGHLAFNDPPVADFKDPLLVKIITLDPACRNQQFHDGYFASLKEVPKQAITITIPVITGASSIVCTVPGPAKAKAVGAMFNGPVTTKCPASILRYHHDCHVFLDSESGRELL